MQGREMYNRSVQRESRELKLARVRVWYVGLGLPEKCRGSLMEEVVPRLSSKDVQVCPRKIGKTSIPEKGTE